MLNLSNSAFLFGKKNRQILDRKKNDKNTNKN
jgi:hypothetical protein